VVVPDQLRVGMVLTSGGICGAHGFLSARASPGLGERVGIGVPVVPLAPAMVMSRWASARFPAPR
jgi:hypothetical protein